MGVKNQLKIVPSVYGKSSGQVAMHFDLGSKKSLYPLYRR